LNIVKYIEKEVTNIIILKSYLERLFIKKIKQNAICSFLMEEDAMKNVGTIITSWMELFITSWM